MAFDRQPTLAGPTLAVRPLRTADHADLYAVARDPMLWAQHPSSDRHEPEVFQAFFDEALASGGALTVREADGTAVGSSRFHAYDPDRAEVEIGWTFLARRLWGGPSNRELKTLMLDHAFGGGIDRVRFRIGPDNRRSRRAVEKLGATLVATDPPDWVIYAIDSARWRAGG